MIDSRQITDMVFEEARCLAERVEFNDAPALNAEAKFARLISTHQLPEPQHISFLIEEVFWASLLTKEGRPCCPRLLYSVRQESMRRALHRLAKPVPLTRDALRKLAPAQGRSDI
jgi:hypothetical protein